MTAGQSQKDAVVSKRQLMKNATAGYVSFFVAAVIGFVVTPILVRHLGVSTFGVLGVLEATIGYLGLLDAGVSTALVQRVAALRAVGDVDRLRNTLGTARVINSISGIVLWIVSVIMATIVRSFIHLGGLSARPVQVALVLLGVSAAISTSSVTAAAVMFGGGRDDRSAVLSLFIGSGSRILQVLVVLHGGGLVGLCVVSTTSTVISTFSVIWLSRKTFPELRGSGWTFSRLEASVLLHVGLRNAILAIAGAASYGIDTVILGAIRTASQVTPYVLAARLVRLVGSLATRGINTFMPRIAHQHAQGDLDASYRSYMAGLFIVLSISLPLEVVLVVFGRPLLGLWLGIVPPHTYSVLTVFLVVTLAQLVGGQSSSVLIATQRQKIIARVAIPVALMNVAFSILATRRYGPLGPVLGSLPQAVLIEAIVYPAMACHALGVSPKRLVRDVAVPAIGIGALSVSVAYMMHLEMNSTSIGSVAIDVIVSLIFGYVVVLGFAMVLWPALYRYIRRAIKLR